MSFCGLTKGISPKMCILCVCVQINKRSFEPFCVWILSIGELAQGPFPCQAWMLLVRRILEGQGHEWSKQGDGGQRSKPAGLINNLLQIILIIAFIRTVTFKRGSSGSGNFM